MSCAVSSMVSARFIGEDAVRVVRPAAYTVAPSLPSSTAIALPQPLVAPVTTATLPARDPPMPCTLPGVSAKPARQIGPPDRPARSARQIGGHLRRRDDKSLRHPAPAAGSAADRI